jgi:hypothetical protein
MQSPLTLLPPAPQFHAQNTPPGPPTPSLSGGTPRSVPHEGKGLFSLVHSEPPPGKTLGKGFVRLYTDGQLDLDSFPPEADEDDVDGENDDEGGLEALVRQAMRDEKKGKGERFVLELNILLKTVPGKISGAIEPGVVGGKALVGEGAEKTDSPGLKNVIRPVRGLPSGLNSNGVKSSSSKHFVAPAPRTTSLPTNVGSKASEPVVTPPSSKLVTMTTASSAAPLPPSSSGTLIADVLRTPRQDKTNSNPPPKSSPATHMALARSVLRNPTSHTLDLAQKLVGKEAFAQILAEMGVQIAASETGLRVDSIHDDAIGSKAGNAVASGSKHVTTAKTAAQASTAPVTAKARERTGSAISTVPVRGKGKQPPSAPSVPPPAQAPGATNIPATKQNSAPMIIRPVCKNCGTTETPRWRVKTLADGKERRVCDACGIYFNKTKQMRPKELWSPQAKRIPLEEIAQHEAAAARAAAAKQAASLGVKAPAASVVQQPKSQPQSRQISRPMEQPTKPLEVTFAEVPRSPIRQARVVSDSVFTTPRRSTRLSQGGSNRNPGVHNEEVNASPKPRRTPRRMAAAAAASKVKATFETTAPTSRNNKQAVNLDRMADAKQLQDKPGSDSGRSPSRDRSLTPPPASEAASRHNESSLWLESDFLELSNGTLMQQFTAIAGSTTSVPIDPSASTSDADQMDFDLSAFIDITENNTTTADDQPKFTQNELDLLLALSQTEEMMNLDGSSATQSLPGSASHLQFQNLDWDASSPWSIPTPTGASAIPSSWFTGPLSTNVTVGSGQQP